MPNCGDPVGLVQLQKTKRDTVICNVIKDEMKTKTKTKSCV